MQILSSDGFQSEQFIAVVNTAVDGIIIIDSKGILQMVNLVDDKFSS